MIIYLYVLFNLINLRFSLHRAFFIAKIILYILIYFYLHQPNSTDLPIPYLPITVAGYLAVYSNVENASTVAQVCKANTALLYERHLQTRSCSLAGLSCADTACLAFKASLNRRFQYPKGIVFAALQAWALYSDLPYIFSYL